MTKKVRTITGDVPPEALGRTLIHEHLCVDWGDLLGRPKVLDFDRDEMADRMVAKMDELYAVGIGAMTECTPIGLGRYLDLFLDVARRSKVKLICSTGFFHESWAPMHLYAQLMDIDQMAALFVREINDGMGETLLKAGLIKCATGEGQISPKEEEVLRAASRAHKQTGCPIITHTTNGLGDEQLDIFESEGVAPDEVILSHIGCEPDPLEASERVLDRGANLSFDRIGMVPAFPEDEHWIMVVGNAIKKGYIDQIMLSHDAAVFAHGYEAASGDHVWDDYTYVISKFVPKLQAAHGISDSQIDTMFVTNTQRVLAF